MEAQKRMLVTWEKVFGQTVRPDSDFFEDLEGDSMAAAALVQAVVEEFGVPMSMVEVFDHPTPAELATLVAQLLAAGG